MTPRMEVYQIEKTLAVAVASVLLANGLNDPKKQQTNDKLSTPRVEIKVVTSGNEISPGKIAIWINQADETEWIDAWTGTISLTTVTRRGASPEQDHYGIMGTARYVMLSQRTDISAAMLFHSLAFVREMGSTPSFSTDNNEDITSVSYGFTMRILFQEKQNEIFIA